MNEFSKRLRQLRNDCNMTQAELSAKIGVSKSSVNMYERGEREPSFETLETIADFFNVKMDYLMGRSNQPDVRLATQVDFDYFLDAKPDNNILLAESEYIMIEKFKRLPLASRQRIEAIIDYDFNLLLKEQG